MTALPAALAPVCAKMAEAIVHAVKRTNIQMVEVRNSTRRPSLSTKKAAVNAISQFQMLIMPLTSA